MSHMKMQKSAAFAKKRLKMNVILTKNIIKLEMIVIIQVNTICNILNLAYSIYNIVALLKKSLCFSTRDQNMIIVL